MNMISIVVPVYNVEEFLPECVESILNQTYQNFEMILVDDGSKDSGGYLCDEYAKKDDRIKVIHKENGGLSDARNKGIDIVKGDYITFIDSDDRIHSKYLEVLLNCALEHECDIVIGNYEEFSETNQINETLKNASVEILSKHDTMMRYFDTKNYQQSIVTAWGTLYKTSLWNDVRYPKGKIHEDEFTTYKLYYKSNKIAYLNEKIYFYRFNANSITRTKFNIKRLVTYEAYENYISFFDKINETQIKSFMEFRLLDFLNIALTSLKKEEIIQAGYDYSVFINRFNELKIKCMLSFRLSLKQKAAIIKYMILHKR